MKEEARHRLAVKRRRGAQGRQGREAAAVPWSSLVAHRRSSLTTDLTMSSGGRPSREPPCLHAFISFSAVRRLRVGPADHASSM